MYKVIKETENKVGDKSYKVIDCSDYIAAYAKFSDMVDHEIDNFCELWELERATVLNHMETPDYRIIYIANNLFRVDTIDMDPSLTGTTIIRVFKA